MGSHNLFSRTEIVDWLHHREDQLRDAIAEAAVDLASDREHWIEKYLVAPLVLDRAQAKFEVQEDDDQQDTLSADIRVPWTGDISLFDVSLSRQHPTPNASIATPTWQRDRLNMLTLTREFRGATSQQIRDWGKSEVDEIEKVLGDQRVAAEQFNQKLPGLVDELLAARRKVLGGIDQIRKDLEGPGI